MKRFRGHVPRGTSRANARDEQPSHLPFGTPAPIARASSTNPLVPIALVRIDDTTVIIARVLTWVIHDPFERSVLTTALQLSYQRPVVLLSKEPCGCQEMWGDSVLLAKLEKLPEAAFHWQMMRISFAAH
ncbi:MAG TPA: hypothetical protein VGM39_12875 [Kofleriaceae bacterium]